METKTEVASNGQKGDEMTNYLDPLLVEKHPPPDTVESPVHWHLFFAVGAASSGIVCGGTLTSWTSPSLPKLSGPEPEGGFSLSPSEAAWVGSLMPLAAALGPIPAGMLGEKLGRRKALGVSAAFILVSWILVLAATSAEWLYVSRVLGGLGLGVMSANIPVYIGEVCVDRVRSACGSAMQVLLTLGMLIPFALGPFLSVAWLAWVCGGLAVLFGAGAFVIPESPRYLLAIGDEEAASKSLQWLRGQSREDVVPELRKIAEETASFLRNRRPFLESFLRIFSTGGNMMAFFLVFGLLLFQQLSGYNAVIFYAEDIFREAGSDVSPALSALLVGLVQVVAAAATVLLTARFSTRRLFIGSSILSAVAHAALGYFFFMRTRSDVSALVALPVTSLVFYIVVYCIGLGAVPWVLLGEVFAPDVKTVSSSVCATLFWVEGFLITQLFSYIVNIAGAAVTFWGFSACCVVSAMFALALLPDTQGKSLQEIQDLLNGHKGQGGAAPGSSEKPFTKRFVENWKKCVLPIGDWSTFRHAIIKFITTSVMISCAL